MKMRLLVLTVLFLLFCFIQHSYAEGPIWVEGSGRACPQVCKDNGGLWPIAAGVYTGSTAGNEYYVCAGNARGEGFRPGYNLTGDWSTVCVVGWGGKELKEPSYYCLCNNKPISVEKNRK